MAPVRPSRAARRVHGASREVRLRDAKFGCATDVPSVCGDTQPQGGHGVAARYPDLARESAGPRDANVLGRKENAMRTVVGLFESGNKARNAIDELARLGFAPRSISVVTNLSTKSAIEAGSAGAGLHTMKLSDVGTVAASGPLGEALERPDGGLAAVLRRMGLSSDLAIHYASGVERGETLESLTVEDADVDRVAAVMKKHAAAQLREDVSKAEKAEKTEETATAGEKAATAGIASGAIGQAAPSKLGEERIGEKRGEGHAFAEEERTIPVYREELRVGKREVERGAVRVTTHVVEKPYSEQVVLREEHVEVERRPADRLVRPGETEFKEGEIQMAEMGEEAIGAKQTRLVEEVIVHKHVAERTATVGDTLRSTQVDVRTFDASSYRGHFDKLKLAGTKFEEHLPAYQFGEGIARPSASSRWEDIEGEARSRWEAQRPGTWDKFRDSIRHAWSRSGEK
jgi:uncharacterized protein (TIGR02271 family)